MESLDNFIPPPEVLHGTLRQLEEAGLNPDAVPKDWLVTILAAMAKWCRTPDGLKFLATSLGLRWDRGRDDRLYEYYNPETGEVHPVPSEIIMFIRGIAIRGNVIDERLLNSFEKNHQRCDGCGMSSHCIKEVRDPRTDRLESLCNYCLSMDEMRRVKEQADPSVCDRCTVTTCAHHPRKATGTVG